MKLTALILLAGILLGGLAGGGCSYYNKGVLKQVAVFAADHDIKPVKQVKVADCVFYNDYSFKIKSSRPGFDRELAALINEARKKESLMLRTEEMKGDTLVMYGEEIKPGDKNYIYALVNAVAGSLNDGSRREFFSLEYQ